MKLLLIILLIATDAASTTKLIPINDFFIIHTSIDTKPIKEALTNVTAAVDTIERIAPNKSNKQARDDILTCHGYRKSANFLIAEIDAMTMNSKKTKRGITFLGDLIHEIAGTPTEEMHDDVVNQLTKLKQDFNMIARTNVESMNHIEFITDGLKDNNNHIKKAAEILQVHNDRLSKLENNQATLFSLIDFISDASNTLFMAEENLRRIGTINSEGKQNYLSIHAIDQDKLRTSIFRRRNSSPHLEPLFSAEPEKYYRHKFTRTSWENGKLHVSVKIPLINKKEDFELVPLTENWRKKSAADLTHFIAIAQDRHTREFSYLTESDLRKCTTLSKNELLCERRKITIKDKNIVIYEIAPTHILVSIVSSSISKEAIQVCNGHITHLSLNETAFLRVSSDCTIQHALFRIEKINYRADMKIPHNEIEMHFQTRQRQQEKKKATDKIIQELLEGARNSTMKISSMEKEMNTIKTRYNIEMENTNNEVRFLKYAGGAVTGSGVLTIIIIIVVIILTKRAIDGLR